MRHVRATARILAAFCLLAALILVASVVHAQPAPTAADSALRAGLARLLGIKPDTVLRVRVDTVVQAPPAPPVVVVTPPPAPLPIVDSLRAPFLAGWRTWEPKRLHVDSLGDLLANYYDRSLAYLLASQLPEFSDSAAVYLARSDSLALHHITQYLAPNACGASPHAVQMEGVFRWYLRQRARSDSLGRANTALAYRYITCTARKLWAAYGVGSGGSYMMPVNGEPRIVGRVLHTQYLAYLVDTVPAERAQFKQQTDSALAFARHFQAADGSYPSIGQVCGGQLNYMVSLLNQVLGKLVEDGYPLDTVATLAQINRGASYLWATQWRPPARTLNYASVTCTGIGAPTPTPDLNMFFAENAGFLYRHTGDSTWLVRGDSALAGSIHGAYLGGSKQFNETFTNGLRYLGFR